MSEELRPCPFCGKEPAIDNNFAICVNDDCELSDYWSGLEVGSWNTRPIEDALKARIAELEAERRWIPVSKSLPEDGEFVLAWDDEIIEVLEYKNTYGGASFLNIADTTVYPTHWMPLPQPPEVQNV